MSNDKDAPVVPGAWRNSERAEAKLRDVLQKGGIPLELRAVDAAGSFAKKWRNARGELVDCGILAFRSVPVRHFTPRRGHHVRLIA